MAILYHSEYTDPDVWKAALLAYDPALEFRAWPQIGDPAEIDCVLCWTLPPGTFPLLTKLRLVCSTAAGTDRLQKDPELPDHVPLTRMADSSQAAGMAAYVLGAVLQHHLRFPGYRAQQQQALWKPLGRPRTKPCRIGVMGLGHLGSFVAAALARAGLEVAGWSRQTRRSIEGVAVFTGEAERAAFLSLCDVLVCILPLTEETRDILDERLFAALPAGAALVHVGRGEQLVEVDLLAALASGQVSGATLDVFRQEPLQAEHPFWAHPAIVITPHIATTADPATAAPQVVENLRRLRTGEPLIGLVDRSRGY